MRKHIAKINKFDWFEGDVLQIVENGLARDYMRIDRMGQVILALHLIARNVNDITCGHQEGVYQLTRDGQVVLS